MPVCSVELGRRRMRRRHSLLVAPPAARKGGSGEEGPGGVPVAEHTCKHSAAQSRRWAQTPLLNGIHHVETQSQAQCELWQPAVAPHRQRR